MGQAPIDIKAHLTDAETIVTALPWRLDTPENCKAAKGCMSALAHQVSALLGMGWRGVEILSALADAADAAGAPDPQTQQGMWRSAIKKAKKRRENMGALVGDLIAEKGTPSAADYAWADAQLRTKPGEAQPAPSAVDVQASRRPDVAEVGTAPPQRAAAQSRTPAAKKKRVVRRSAPRVPFRTELPRPLVDDVNGFSASTGAGVETVVEMALREYLSTRGWRSTADARQQQPSLIFVAPGSTAAQ